MTKSTKFFSFAVIFLQPFCPCSFFFLFSVFFLCVLSFSLSLYYILWFFYHFLHPRVGQVLGVLFSLLPLRILEPSILSCKAVCSLFRYHLHINAARKLAGQHLMRGQYTLRYLFSLILILHLIFSHPLCCKVCPRRYFKRMISPLATSNRRSEVVIVLGHG